MTTVTPIEFSEVAVDAGVRLRYAEQGLHHGRPLVLLHGYSDSWFSFSRILSLMPDELRVIVPDQRGHGNSDRPVEGYSPDRLASDVVEMLQFLRVPPATIIGHCMGGMVAQRVAAIAPERVSSLVLIDSAVSAVSDSILGLAPAVQSLTDPVDAEFVREFQTSTIHRPAPPEFLDRVVAESLKLPARVWKSVLNDLLNWSALNRPAGEIQCPVTLFWGDRDTIFDRQHQDELQRHIPHACLQVFRDVGHSPHWEVPEDFVACLLLALDGQC